MNRQYPNQLRPASQSTQLLAHLAKECKMSVGNIHPIPYELEVLAGEIRAANYMTSVFDAKYRNTNSIPEAANYRQCMLQCKQHAEQLKLKQLALLDAESQRKQYIRQSI